MCHPSSSASLILFAHDPHFVLPPEAAINQHDNAPDNDVLAPGRLGRLSRATGGKDAEEGGSGAAK